MSGKRLRLARIAVIGAIIGVVWWGCGEDEDDSSTGGDFKNVRVVVLENATNTLVANAYVVVDGNTDDACHTSEPGGDSGGECYIVLILGEHRFVVSKPGYQTTTSTRLVTSMTSSVFLPLYK